SWNSALFCAPARSTPSTTSDSTGIMSRSLLPDADVPPLSSPLPSSFLHAPSTALQTKRAAASRRERKQTMACLLGCVMSSSDAAAAGPSATVANANAIHVWTDGACEGNPGPAGLGVVIIDGGEHRELSEYLGQGTNNIAELTAILRGLESIADRKRPVIVYSDSQ